MAVTVFEIKSRSPLAGGLAFGEVGPYEQLEGTVHFAVDPHHPCNGAITDLNHAPRDANGQVSCSADFRILRPAEPQRGNHRILFDVLNRGRQLALRYFNRGALVTDPTTPLDLGDGFLLRQGYTVAWCGWQYDVPQVSGLMSINIPEAVTPDGPISGKVVVTFRLYDPDQVQGLSDRMHRPYPTNDINDQAAALIVRDSEDAPPQMIPRDQWTFAKLEAGRVVPDASHIYLASGFQPGKVYQVLYFTTGAPVIGLGFAAQRDTVSFLRYGTARDGNPCAGDVQHAYAFGSSLSGRFLRHFLYLGMNEDEEERIVFDGLIAHVAGGRRGEFNQRFGQPSSTAKNSMGNLFPFAGTERTDPETGRTDGLLSRLAARGKVPKIFYINSPGEYWRGDASLMHTDLSGTRDVAPSEYVRIYHYAGTQHGAGDFPLTNTRVTDGARGQQPFNCVDTMPLLRAALVGLDRWVSTNEMPPPSRYPRIDDGTAVPQERVADTFKAIPGVRFPGHLPQISRLDFGPEADAGIATTLPPVVGKAYSTLVPAVDEDGNELGSIRLPDISVPLATYTGWNLRHPDVGAPDQLLGQILIGSTIPFPATNAQREASGDPRRSTEERYGSKEGYLDLVRRAAQTLVDEGYLLAEDLNTVTEQASQRYDLFRNLVKQPQVAGD